MGDRAATSGMVWLDGGTFQMGSDAFYPEERPLRRVAVEGFWIERHPVTVRDFRRFVAETGYVTVAERPLDPERYAAVDPALRVPGSLVFRGAPGPVPLDDPRRWWAYVPGAAWKRPGGPGTGVGGRDRHPVTHVAFADAVAYAAWAGKELPTEGEWEYAARGGLDGATFAWGDEERPGGRLMANSWQGEFPWRNRGANGHRGTSPLGAFAPNGYGLFDMCGNVWEWTADRFSTPGALPPKPCCVPPAAAPAAEPPVRRVVKGGSHLCAPEYCLRYRPAARQGEDEDSATSHLGFRCVLRGAGPRG